MRWNVPSCICKPIETTKGCKVVLKPRKRKEQLESLFELHEQGMYRIAYAILHDEGQAEDAVMSAFERIVRCEGLPRRADSDDARRLCGAIVKSCAIDIYRKNARTWEREMLTGDATMQGTTMEPLKEDAPGFDEMVETLPVRYREVVVERFGNGLSIKETADKLGISEGNVRTRQHRAITVLRSIREEE